MQPSDADRVALQRLEEELWREETRFDRERMNEIIASDFLEFGRSGRTYTREECLAIARQSIEAELPLPRFEVRLLHPDIAHVTYDSAVRYNGVIQRARRSSIWSRTATSWQLRFHQGTPYEKEA